MTKLLTTRQVGELLGLHEWTVRKKISTGEIEAVNIGGPGNLARWRIKPADVDAYIDTLPHATDELHAAVDALEN